LSCKGVDLVTHGALCDVTSLMHESGRPECT